MSAPSQPPPAVAATTFDQQYTAHKNINSVITPEGCASILWRSPNSPSGRTSRKSSAANTVRTAWAIAATLLVLTADRGVPVAGLILVGLCAIFVFITTRTAFGRHLFAVGGNAEAARRAGIHVTRLRMTEVLETELPGPQGRPFPLVDRGFDPIKELF